MLWIIAISCFALGCLFQYVLVLLFHYENKIVSITKYNNLLEQQKNTAHTVHQLRERNKGLKKGHKKLQKKNQELQDKIKELEEEGILCFDGSNSPSWDEFKKKICEKENKEIKKYEEKV